MEIRYMERLAGAMESSSKRFVGQSEKRWSTMSLLWNEENDTTMHPRQLILQRGCLAFLINRSRRTAISCMRTVETNYLLLRVAPS